MFTLLESECFITKFPSLWELSIKETSDAHVKITMVVCLTVVLVTFMLLVGVLVWRFLEEGFKVWSDYRKRCFDINDREWRQKSDLLDKLLDVVKLEVEKNSEIDTYTNVLFYLVEKSQKGDLKGVTQGELISALTGKKDSEESNTNKNSTN